jgi:putative flippase GtrA
MATALLLTALVLPVVLYWLLRSRVRLSDPIAAGVAVAAGWILNFAWAFAAHESTQIAARFGWICPAVLVLLTWLVLGFMSRRAGDS